MAALRCPELNPQHLEMCAAKQDTSPSNSTSPPPPFASPDLKPAAARKGLTILRTKKYEWSQFLPDINWPEQNIETYPSPNKGFQQHLLEDSPLPFLTLAISSSE
jgi:hypothetical protein